MAIPQGSTGHSDAGIQRIPIGRHWFRVGKLDVSYAYTKILIAEDKSATNTLHQLAAVIGEAATSPAAVRLLKQARERCAETQLALLEDLRRQLQK